MRSPEKHDTPLYGKGFAMKILSHSLISGSGTGMRENFYRKSLTVQYAVRDGTVRPNDGTAERRYQWDWQRQWDDYSISRSTESMNTTRRKSRPKLLVPGHCTK